MSKIGDLMMFSYFDLTENAPFTALGKETYRDMKIGTISEHQELIYTRKGISGMKFVFFKTSTE